MTSDSYRTLCACISPCEVRRVIGVPHKAAELMHGLPSFETNGGKRPQWGVREESVWADLGSKWELCSWQGLEARRSYFQPNSQHPRKGLCGWGLSSSRGVSRYL